MQFYLVSRSVNGLTQIKPRSSFEEAKQALLENLQLSVGYFGPDDWASKLRAKMIDCNEHNLLLELAKEHSELSVNFIELGVDLEINLGLLRT